MRHEKRSYTNYHQSCYVCTWYDSCLSWCFYLDILQYVAFRFFTWCVSDCYY
nr:MAG TPA: hypothetical protein [Microviridae sp.]